MRTNSCLFFIASAAALALGLSGCRSTHASRISQHSGLVVDDQHHPIANATVEIYRRAPVNSFLSSELELKGTARTDDQGAFRFPVFDPATVLVAQEGKRTTWQTAWRRTLSDPPLTLVLTQPTEIAGWVASTNGQPVAGAEVWVAEAYCLTPLDEGRLGSGRLTGKPARDRFRTHTTADGHFRLEGLPANCGVNLVVIKPGMAMREPSLNPDKSNAYLMQCCAGERDVELDMEPGADIQGKVLVHASGRPIGGARLWLRRDEGTYSFYSGREPVESAPDGSYKFSDVASGAYHVMARFSSADAVMPEWVAEPVPVTVVPGQKLSGVEVPAIKGGILEVRVLDQKSRQPLEGAYVASDKPYDQVSASTPENGTARFHLPPGEYQVSAVKGMWSSEYGKVEVKRGQTSYRQFELTPPLILAGTVHDPSGAPAPDVRIIVRTGGKGLETSTDRQGRFQATWNPFSLGSRSPWNCVIARDWSRNVAAESSIDAATTNLDLALQPALTLAGQVTDIDAKPITNAHLGLMVHLRGLGSGATFPGLDQTPSRTDAQGRFEFRVLPQGLAYGVQVSADGYGFVSRELKPEETKTHRLDLAFMLKQANLRLAGRVVGTDGKPLAGAYLSATGEGQPRGSARTGADGSFELNHLCAGPVQVGALYQGKFESVPAKGGDTNLLIKISVKDPSEGSTP